MKIRKMTDDRKLLEYNIIACERASKQIFEEGSSYSDYSKEDKRYMRTYIAIIWHKFQCDHYEGSKDLEELKLIDLHRESMNDAVKELETLDCTQPKEKLISDSTKLIMECKSGTKRRRLFSLFRRSKR